MSDPYAVSDLLDKVMTTVNAVFEADNIPLPDRQYVYAGDQGETVHDCEQVTVSLAQLYSGAPGDQAQLPSKCDQPMSAVIIVEIVRCIPVPTPNGRNPPIPPSPEALSASARSQAADAYLLMQAGLVVGNDWLGSIAETSTGPASAGYQAMILNLVVAIP